MLVRRLRGFFICGSLNVSHISLTSPGAKKRSIISILVRKKATFFNPSSNAWVAPVHIRAPLISTPIKLIFGNSFANPTVYSPLPHPSSSTMGLSFLKYISRHRPFISNGTLSATENGYWNTFSYLSMSRTSPVFLCPYIGFNKLIFSILSVYSKYSTCKVNHLYPYFNDKKRKFWLFVYLVIHR